MAVQGGTVSHYYILVIRKNARQKWCPGFDVRQWKLFFFFFWSFCFFCNAYFLFLTDLKYTGGLITGFISKRQSLIIHKLALGALWFLLLQKPFWASLLSHFPLSLFTSVEQNRSLVPGSHGMKSGNCADALGGLLGPQELKVLACWRHQRAKWVYEARSRFWIWLVKYSSYVIKAIRK